MADDWKVGSRRVGGLWRQAEDAAKGDKRYEVERKGRKGEVHVRKGESVGEALGKKGRVVHDD